jgi:hypothetical protein
MEWIPLCKESNTIQSAFHPHLFERGKIIRTLKGGFLLSFGCLFF